DGSTVIVQREQPCLCLFHRTLLSAPDHAVLLASAAARYASRPRKGGQTHRENEQKLARRRDGLQTGKCPRRPARPGGQSPLRGDPPRPGAACPIGSCVMKHGAEACPAWIEPSVRAQDSAGRGG